MTAFEDLAQRYIDAWNESDPTVRRAAVDALFCADASFVDPLAVADGPEAISATIAAVQGQFPGFEFRLVGPVDAHHDQARFRWELGPANQEAPIVGFDVVLTDGAGRIQKVLGFFDKVPAAA
ncbi:MULTISPECIES: nuclear transport factor 2 family protein [Mycolicibacter]|uniref:Nuclear transport factor 2 family protein n=1 Tax=Mycolicibacter virginiensis TaxID=1795032 RepID=A0A9X7IRK6_9MYCO|nr:MULTISPECIES: nuclear transport factor 2 family protein [Mycobacteriaceae]OBG35651.1 polyketide cyclase [Mycolicibacter heraklionensis]OBJ33812.1 polyketide cyclase [Mycolicibacter heraklionensis]PQM54077.1 nuclear transport factor 2 family protein [Mycolicibacter virginiensis]ULP49119.1 nuclear transport factor 2 family protein [Mycolicibacter virginiensis]